MLHSTLPRAFLPPVLQSYAAGYCADEAHHLYSTSASYVPCIEDPYSRIPDHRVDLRNWEAEARPMSPCPLDLSIKPAQNHNEDTTRIEDNDEIEVDDDDDAKCRITLLQRRTVTTKRSYADYEELPSVIEDAESETRRSDSVHSYHSHEDVHLTRKEDTDQQNSVHSRALQDEILRGHQIHGYNYEAISMKKEALDPREIGHRKTNLFQDSSAAPCITERHDGYHGITSQPKILLASPTTPRGQSYHQQLLMTPQHHLQGINAPMTPPSTPSPPQCPRRRPRDESDVTPASHSLTSAANITPKHSAGLSDKTSQRPKKKHARRLKFDEDTSSPVSGTVILGPDEAVVTGDIDPAFNIVEVTEEARAELAKIENRLGPYQCKLCRQLHDDAFQLAQHRCSRIAHVEYRCPECDKRFSCPANLASHRRWHKPRITNGENTSGTTTAATNASGSATTTRDPEISCTRCEAKFTRTAALRKHLATQHPETNNNGSMANNNNNNNDNNSGFDELNNSMLGKPLCITGPVHLGNASINNEMP